MAEPEGARAVEVGQEGGEVAHVVCEGVGARVGGDAGAAVAARVWGDGVEAERGEGVELGFPGLAIGGPAVDEDDEGSVGWAGGPVEGGLVAAVGEGVFAEDGGRRHVGMLLVCLGEG